MALVGFYAAIAPTLLAERLHVTNHAVAGAIFFELATVVSGTILLTRHLSSRFAMLGGAGLMLPSVILVVAAEILASTTILLLATAVCGAAAGLGYRGSMRDSPAGSSRGRDVQLLRVRLLRQRIACHWHWRDLDTDEFAHCNVNLCCNHRLICAHCTAIGAQIAAPTCRMQGRRLPPWYLRTSGTPYACWSRSASSWKKASTAHSLQPADVARAVRA
jgi:hypothetical protein